MADSRRQFDAALDGEGAADLTAFEPATALDFQAQRERGGLAKHGRPSYRMILTLAMPSLVEQVFSLVILMTDTWVAGNGVNAGDNHSASAAVGTMTFLQWFCNIMTSAFGVGATAIVARSIGAKRPRVASRVAGTAMAASFVVGAALALLLYVFARQVVGICGLHGDAHLFGTQYLRIMAITICLQSVGIIGMACLRGAGEMVWPMIITGSIAAVNVIAVPALAFGWFGLPALTIRGNALGTMIAFTISGIATLVLLLSGKTKLRLRWRHFRIIPHILNRILRISVPSWAEGLLLWLGQIIIVLVVINTNDAALAKIFGQDMKEISGTTMSAHTAVLRIEAFAFLPGFGFGIVAAALVGQYLGAGMPHEARHAARIVNRLAFGTMTLLALPMVLFPSFLVHVMVKDPHVVEVGRWPMILAGLAQPGFAIAIIMSSGLKGAGETVWPMVATIVGMFLVRFPPVLLLAWWLLPKWGFPAAGLIAVWIGIFLDLNFRAVLNGVVFRRGKWQRKVV